MRRLNPTTYFDSVGRRHTHMKEDPCGGYVSVDEVFMWLAFQRNDVPMTGEEAAQGFLEALRGEEKK